ncbi:hypothetical protein PMAYCL1PPCAC_31045, partial [Pristionchus mayeri]
MHELNESLKLASNWMRERQSRYQEQCEQHYVKQESQSYSERLHDECLFDSSDVGMDDKDREDKRYADGIQK